MQQDGRKMTHVQEKKYLQNMAESLSKQIHFKKADIEMLQKYYIDRFGKVKLDRSKFRDFVVTLGITDDTIMDRVFKVFDANNDSHVCMEEWIKGISMWLRGTEDEHSKYTFKVYDMNDDGFIGRDDMFNILKKAVIKPQADEDPEEGIRDLVEMAQRRLGSKNNQGTTVHNISPEDFADACKQDTLHVELLGQCIPPRSNITEFEETVFCPKIQERKWYNN